MVNFKGEELASPVERGMRRHVSERRRDPRTLHRIPLSTDGLGLFGRRKR